MTDFLSYELHLTPPAPFPEREGGELPSPFRGGVGGGVMKIRHDFL